VGVGKLLCGAHRGSDSAHGEPQGKGSVAVNDFTTGRITNNCPRLVAPAQTFGNVNVNAEGTTLSQRQATAR
jgi:hypothetical protein